MNSWNAGKHSVSSSLHCGTFSHNGNAAHTGEVGDRKLQSESLGETDNFGEIVINGKMILK
jgi:hypothetical protein